MAYTKPLVTTEVVDHDGNEITFADAIVNGKTVRYGSIVKEQLLREDTVDAVANDNVHHIIPYHAVLDAIVTTADSAEITPAEDAFCVAE